MTKKNHKKGFGLLEVLLAGLIIIMMLSALVVVARAAVQNSIYLQQRSQATFLAQEGMEIVRQIRDTNYIDGSSATQWDSMYGDASDCTVKTFKIGYWAGSGGYYGTPFPIAWTSSTGKYNLCTAGTYDYTIGGISYNRLIRFTASTGLAGVPPIPAPTGTSYIAEVTVGWDSQGRHKEIKIKELIANSRQGF